MDMRHRSWSVADQSFWVDTLKRYIRPNPTSPVGIEPKEGWSLSTLSQSCDATIRWISRNEGDPSVMAATLFFAKALKKFRLSDPALARQREQKAVEAFCAANTSAAVASGVPWPYCVRMHQTLSRWLRQSEYFDDAREIGKFGPGAVAERLRHPDRIRYLSRWTAPGDLTPSFYCHADNVPIVGHDRSRLCAVPKDWNKDRLITVEPCYNSFMQQRARDILLSAIHRGPLRGTAMDLGWVDSQAVQRGLALKASKERNLGTLDLSQASDRITWSMVQQVFPSWVVDMLDACRTPFYEYGGDVSRAYIYAGMGNATTFVVETLFFSAYIESLRWAHGLPLVADFRRGIQCSVFGDDIIASNEVCSLVASRPFPGLVVNESKSFHGCDERLRESCGVFAYDGVDITVPRILGYSDTYAGRLGFAELIRNLQKAPTQWPGLSALVTYLASLELVPNWPFTVESYPAVSVSTYTYSAEPPLRINQDLQRVEVKLPCEEPRQEVVPLFEDEKGFPRRQAEALYHYWFTGRLATSYRRKAGGLGHRGYAVFPSDGVRRTNQWRQAFID